MSEPKYYKLFHRASALTSPEFISVVEFGTNDEVYLKSEADKVIAEKDAEIAELKEQVHDYALGLYVMQARAEKEARHHKYKRCLDKADWCKLQDDNFFKIHNIDHMKMGCGRAKRTFYRKWHKRWLALAYKFKEAK